MARCEILQCVLRKADGGCVRRGKTRVRDGTGENQEDGENGHRGNEG